MRSTTAARRPWQARGLMAFAGVAILAAAVLPQSGASPEMVPASTEKTTSAKLTAFRAAPTTEVQPAAASQITLAEAPEPAPERTVWDDLADCESGEWLPDGGFVEGSAEWASSSHRTFQGGVQFHPVTWNEFKDADMPAAAYDATREQQIEVAERVLDAQGWNAWPVCSRRIGVNA